MSFFVYQTSVCHPSSFIEPIETLKEEDDDSAVLDDIGSTHYDSIRYLVFFRVGPVFLSSLLPLCHVRPARTNDENPASQAETSLAP